MLIDLDTTGAAFVLRIMAYVLSEHGIDSNSNVAINWNGSPSRKVCVLHLYKVKLVIDANSIRSLQHLHESQEHGHKVP